MKKEKAKRWGLNDGVKALRDGDVKARLDIATRFPMFATATLEEIIEEVPAKFMTVRQVEIRLKKKLLKGHVEDTDEEDDDSGEDEKEVIKKQPVEPVEEVETEVIEKKDTSTADEFYGEDDDKDPPKERKVDKGTGEIYPPDKEKTTEEPKEEPKKDIPDDDFDELFSDMED